VHGQRRADVASLWQIVDDNGSKHPRLSLGTDGGARTNRVRAAAGLFQDP